MEIKNLSENAMRVLEKRYLIKDKDGKIVETFEEMFRRVSWTVAEADLNFGSNDVEKTARRFYECMAERDFLPNSPTLMNAGTELGQLSACFVLPVKDSMESIFDAIKYTALIHQSGGGTGFSFSRLRPMGDVVRSTGGVASGPVSFMQVFDSATEVVKQGGRRRGANMGILRVDHPDILEFIKCKADEKSFQNFNISIALTDTFMQALEQDEEYELVNPRTKTVVRKERARQVLRLITEMAWRMGDPGVIFLDKINKYNPTPQLGEIEATNPCGEQPLLAYESCNLGSINLSNMVVDDFLDWEKLRETVWTAIHFLDNVIEINSYPLQEIENMTKRTRKIGLGVMGFADMLIKLRIPYDSEEALTLASSIMEFIDYQSKLASIDLAERRGCFPTFKGSLYEAERIPLVGPYEKNVEKLVSPIVGRILSSRPDVDWKEVVEGLRIHGIRNATTTTIAPTGSLSIVADASSGIEPLYAIAYTKHITVGDLIEVHGLFKQIAKEAGFYSEELVKRLLVEGNLAEVDNIPDWVKRIFVTAHEIDPEWHVRMQSAFQKFVDNAVSKTINMRREAPVEDVERAYLLAYDVGCKGITIYRDGSKESQVLTRVVEEDETRRPRSRPEIILGATIKMRTSCGNLYVTVNEDKQGLFEVFARLGKSGGCLASYTEAIGRLVSLALRTGTDVNAVINQL
ncbi:MAG: vitamin B12-dependent ribonucleotide reductase, partial [Nitrososphaeria archaeon]|nr:vitamin B12-dependent ribonucleotide reductase [Nitrososphaeria archaeon]NIN52158.1 vitamin B12-dependent ribonucleotide reductase [Nitrososphaeria archaeon]NIQ32611.1 vitamin B12-dependent ribonucleotide reductase [Nitrososphaeria archaeon]